MSFPPARFDEPTYHCWRCQDDPSGWQPFWCPGAGPYHCDEPPGSAPQHAERRLCARPKPHSRHTFVERCDCWAFRPRVAAANDAKHSD